MITSAAVKIFDIKQNKEWIIPCHRHCDAFHILKEFGYKKNIDYKELGQGFLDEHDKFYTRMEAREHANKYKQTLLIEHGPLFSEDLW